MLSVRNVPEKHRDEFDDKAIRAIAKMAEEHYMDTCCLEEAIDESYQIPLFLLGYSHLDNDVADSMYNIMCGLIKYGADVQMRYSQAQFGKVFTSCFAED